MSNSVGVIVGCFLLGIFIGAILANTTSNFAIEVMPNNSLRAAIAFK